MCSQFHSKEFKPDGLVCEGGAVRYQLGPTITPIGETLILCDSIVDLDPYLPRLLSSAPRPTVKLPIPEAPGGEWGTYSLMFSESSPAAGSLTRADFGSMKRDSSSALDLLEFSTTAEGQMSRDVEMDNIDEFWARIENVQREFPTDIQQDVEAVRAIFTDVQSELRVLEAELQMNAD
jgi:hypothetical protein